MQSTLLGSLFGFVLTSSFLVQPAIAQSSLFISYPSNNHETTSDRIFLIGTAPPTGEVTVNGDVISRSSQGHFAPSFPLEMGENRFVIRHENQETVITVRRVTETVPTPNGAEFAKGSLMPNVDIARMPGETVCFSAVAPENANVAVRVGDRVISLLPDPNDVTLPANNSVLTGQNDPQPRTIAGRYEGCTQFSQPGSFGAPQFELQWNGQTATQAGTGDITILDRDRFTVAEVTTDGAIARTGPSTDYSRLTPLPLGTQASVTGREGDWLRLDYGAWIRTEEAQTTESGSPPRSTIRSIRSDRDPNWTRVYFPLQVPVPVEVQQKNDTLTLTLHNTTAQTDFIAFGNNPFISAMDWEQVDANRVQYRFQFAQPQQWGYTLDYEGTTLVLSLRHPPQVGPSSLAGTTIVIDPGHGGPEDLGARGPDGYPEKDVALRVSQLLRDELERRGATVVMTRDTDIELWLYERTDIIAQNEPTIALSVHYNALPDSGDAENTAGVGMFWYHPQSRDLAEYLHDRLVSDLNRPSYGVFWANFALARPTIAPSVLLELGFAINPEEYEWIRDPRSQQELAVVLADAIADWIQSGGAL